MSFPTYHAPEHTIVAHDAIGSIVVSTVVETRGASIMGYETAIKAGSGSFAVVAMFCEEERAEALAAHALLVEQLGAMM